MGGVVEKIKYYANYRIIARVSCLYGTGGIEPVSFVYYTSILLSRGVRQALGKGRELGIKAAN